MRQPYTRSFVALAAAIVATFADSVSSSAEIVASLAN